MAGQAEDERRPLAPAGEELDDVQQALVGPVDILEDEHQRCQPGNRVEVATPGLEQLLAWKAADRAEGQDGPQGGSDRRVGIRTVDLADPRVELGLRGRGRVVVEDLRVDLDGVGKRRVARLGVGKAAALAPVERLGQPVEVLLELPGEARLADARRADHRDQVGTPVGDGPSHRLLQERELLVAADQRGLDPERRATPAAAGLDRDRPPGRHGQGLALEDGGRELLVVDDLPRRRVGRGSDHDGPGCGGLLESGGRVDRIAGDEQVPLGARAGEVDQDLTGLDADPQGWLLSPLGSPFSRQLGHRGLHLKGRPNRALGVVLVDRRHAEDGQHRVPRELLDGALVPCHLGRETAEDVAHERSDKLRVVRLAE